MDPELLRAMQAFYMSGETMPTYYETGPSPNPDAPELDPWAQNVFATGAPLDVNSKGEPVPFGLDTSKSLMNYQQDLYGSLADPMNAYMASTMGGEGFAPGAFGQIAKRKPIEAIQGSQLALMAQSPGSIEGTLAELILSGMTAAQAAAEVRNMIRKPDDYGTTPEEAAVLQAQLPAIVDQFGKETPDFNAVDKIATSLYEPYMKERATLSGPGIETDEQGRVYSTEMVDSPQLEFIKKLGLPDPTARYDLDYALETNPAIRGLLSQNVTNEAQASELRKTLNSYVKKIEKQRDNERSARESDIAKKAIYAKKMQDYAYKVQGSMGDYMSGLNAAARPPAVPNQDAYNAREAALAPYQSGEGWRPIPGQAAADSRMGRGPMMGPGAGGLQMEYGRVPAEIQPNLPTPPAAPTDLSLYGRERGGLFNKVIQDTVRKLGFEPRGTTADDVARAYNRALDVLPGIGGERMAREGARKPLQAATRAAEKASYATNRAMIEAMLPNYARHIAGRTPAKDVVQQRLLPLYASGAFGQQGLPNAYPNRNMVAAALFGG